MAKAKPKIVVVLGPTSSGKSSLAVDLAKKFKGEVVSADSRQVYKGMDIGTGKITKKEMKGIRHHLLDIYSPKRTFTAGEFQKKAKDAVRKTAKRGKVPFICGGTGFYIDTFIYNYKLPKVNRDILLRRKLEKMDLNELYEKLKKFDPQRAKEIDRKNKRRLVRSLEIAMKTKRPLPRLQKKSPYKVLKIGISLPPEVLRGKIDKRLRSRLRQGMVKEVEGLKKEGVSSGRLDNLGLEYRWINKCIEGEITRKEAEEILKKEIWQYARRQMTWFRRDSEIRWVKSPEEAENLVEEFLR